ncbi:MAG: protein kinase domain-containing protein [Nannocystales bacterium]
MEPEESPLQRDGSDIERHQHDTVARHTREEDGLPVDAPEPGVHAEAMKADIASQLFGSTAGALRIGRYEVREAIGEGGMGVVLSAWDPSLGRLVALKLLGSASEKEALHRARMVREAKAMAQLSHPNVVHVYEVGDHEGDVFVAMELIDGKSLKDWLTEGPHSVDRVFDVFDQAGRGLAAAHGAGLVHRDFKPSNAILGADGRVRVVDFGLAVSSGHSTESLQGPDSRSGISGEKLTRTGAVLGTPAYMAPEQFRGENADARADQFSFCVALFAALAGERPYTHATLRDRPESAAISAWSSIPRTLRPALRKGLSIAPSGRWASMDALLVALRRGRGWARRGPWLTVGLVGLAVSLPFIATSDSPCSSLSKPAELWTPQTQSRVHGSFTATEVPYAENAWSSASSGIEDFLARWESTRAKVCKGRVDPAVLSCLERSVVVFDSVVTEYAAIDASNIAQVQPLVTLLRSPEFCIEPGDDDIASGLDHDILAKLEAGGAQVLAHRAEAATQTLTELIEDPRLQGTDALAEAYRLRARARRLMAEPSAALDDLVSSIREGNDSLTRARGVIAWLVELTHQERWESARDARRLVEGHVSEAMPLQLRADATVARAEAFARQRPQEFDEAVVLYERAIELRLGLHEPVGVASARLGLAGVLMTSAKKPEQERARNLLNAVAETYEEHLGRTHPRRAAVLYDLGVLHADSRLDLAAGEPFLQEAAEIQTEGLPARSPSTARTRIKLADVLFNLGKVDEAVPHANAGWEYARTLPATNSDHIAARRLLANITTAAEDYDAALEHNTALLAINPEDPMLHQNRASIQIKLNHPKEAAKALAQTRKLIADFDLDDETAALFELFLQTLDAELLSIEGKTAEAIALVDDLLADLARPGPHQERPELAVRATKLQGVLDDLRRRLVSGP